MDSLGSCHSLSDPPGGLLLTLPILELMRPIEGWLDDHEADLLIAVAARALSTSVKSKAIVEVGSYCGRSTVVLGSALRVVCPSGKVYAVDPHRGQVSAKDDPTSFLPPTLETFRRNVASAGLSHLIETLVKHSFDVTWTDPICLLFIDGLHDYENVARDFFHFEAWLEPGGFVAFHDYAEYYPGVLAFVNELLVGRRFQKVAHAGSLVVLRKE